MEQEWRPVYGFFLCKYSPDVATFFGCDVAKVHLDEKLGQCRFFTENPVECVETSAQVDDLTLLIGQR